MTGPARASVVLLLLLGLAGLAGLAGCSDAPSDPEVPMRQVIDATGTRMEVPVAPLAVGAVGPGVRDGMAALGVAEPAGDGPRDLYVVDAADRRTLAELRSRAPTFVAGGGGWRASFTRLADVLGKAAEGRAVLKRYDDSIREARHDLNAYSATSFAIARWHGGGMELLPGASVPSAVLDDLELPRGDLDADYLFFAGTEADLAAARASAGFGDLTAVREAHVLRVDPATWSASGGPMLRLAVVSDIRAALA